MTTPSTERKAGPLLGTGAQTAWPFTFKVFAETDIAVTIATSLGVETTLVYGVDYDVTLNANQETSPGGTVTYPISGTPLPTGSRLVIVGNLPYDQPLDLPSGGNFSPLAVENELDRIVMQIQQLAEKTGRALQVSITTDADVTLPPPAASQLIGWDSTGENLENVPLSELGTAIAFGTYRYDTFTGDGAETEFALSEDPAVLANLDVSISGVVQVPGTDYSLVSGNLVFASAPPNGSAILARYGQALTALPDSDQITFVQAGAGATTRTVQNKLRDFVSVKDFGAVGDGITDDSAAVQATLDAVLAAGGGTVYFPRGTYLCNTPLVAQYGVNLIGESRASTTIKKDSTTTKAVTIYTSPIVSEIYLSGTLPSNINAILVLTGPSSTSGRYTGIISDLTFEGTYATAGNYESHKVDLGIVSVGSVSDFALQNCNIKTVTHALIAHTIFVAEIRNNRVSNCIRGFGIDGTSTSTHVSSNYAISCRDYGYYFRALLYSEIAGNACDSLNRSDYYPTRNRACDAYVFRSMRNCTITNNGIEYPLGRGYRFIDSVNLVFEGNSLIGLGSDYTGAEEIAFIYSDYKMENCRIKNNFGYAYNPSGLTFGGANAAKHHNIYFEGTNYVVNNEFTNNMVSETTNGTVVDAGWGNNVPTTWINAAYGGDLPYTHSPTIRANIQGNLAVTYNAGDKHYVHRMGTLVHVFGKFDVTITYTTASSYLIIEGFPTNQANLWKIAVTGVEGGSSLTKKLASIRINSSGNGGICFDENDVIFDITDIPTGSTLQIFYDGWYQST